jgi:hypothetical protein
MSTCRLRSLFAACLLLVVASCFDGRSPTIEPEMSPRAAVAAPSGNTAMPATLRMAFVRTQQKAAGYELQSDAAGTLRGRAGARSANRHEAQYRSRQEAPPPSTCAGCMEVPSIRAVRTSTRPNMGPEGRRPPPAKTSASPPWRRHPPPG